MPVRLATKPLEKVWGSPLTEPWYRNPGQKNIGEIWFLASDATPLLVKLLLTSDNLSVQVHPGDDYAREHENGSPGKTEMWHVLRAEPGAKIAIGLKRPETRERVREAALTGEIVSMLRWIEVQAGETFFLPAGTIHAIGGGLALCEVQELSDITYRLYDFDRGRELHLDKAFDVARLEPYDGRVGRRGDLLAECEYFRAERVDVNGSAVLQRRDGSCLCVALAGAGKVAGLPFGPGEAFEIAAGEGPCAVESTGASMLLAQVP